MKEGGICMYVGEPGRVADKQARDKVSGRYEMMTGSELSNEEQAARHKKGKKEHGVLRLSSEQLRVQVLCGTSRRPTGATGDPPAAGLQAVL